MRKVIVLILFCAAVCCGQDLRTIDAPDFVKVDAESSVYSFDLSDAAVKIGDENLFRPVVTSEKFDGEAWLAIVHPDSFEISTEKESLADGELSVTVDSVIHKYYALDANSLEYEIILPSRPATNIITMYLDFPAGIEFWYQDTLENDYKNNTPTEYVYGEQTDPNEPAPIIGSQPAMTLEEYLERHDRPENVVGSYAVYFNKRHGKYKTGKLCHIYRPKLIDDNGAEKWADLHIDPATKILTITMDSAWLDKAAYPVTVDPTFGYTSAGSSSANYNDQIVAQLYVSSDDILITPSASTTIHVYQRKTPNASDIRMGIYDNISSAPGYLRGYTGSTSTSGPTPDWKDLPLTNVDNGMVVKDGGGYWLALHAHDDVDYYFDTGFATTGVYNSEAYENGMIDTWSTDGTTGTYKYSIYLTGDAITAADPGNANLVALFKMNDNAASSTVTDDSATAHNGAIVNDENNYTSDNYNASGKLNGAFDFDGTNDYVTITDDSAYDETSTISVFAWVYSATPGAADVAVSKLDATNTKREWWIAISDVSGGEMDLDILFGASGGGYSGYERSDVRVLDEDTWHFVGFTFDTGTVILYVDGYSVTSTTEDGSIPAAINNEDAPLEIATYESGSGLWDGTIDVVTFYTECLTPGEVKYLYNSGTGREDIGPSGVTTPVYYYMRRRMEGNHL